VVAVQLARSPYARMPVDVGVILSAVPRATGLSCYHRCADRHG
jgi:hypothetical protein